MAELICTLSPYRAFNNMVTRPLSLTQWKLQPNRSLIVIFIHIRRSRIEAESKSKSNHNCNGLYDFLYRFHIAEMLNNITGTNNSSNSCTKKKL